MRRDAQIRELVEPIALAIHDRDRRQFAVHLGHEESLRCLTRPYPRQLVLERVRGLETLR